ncbi:MAG: lytic transglycosylase domain-containing protein [bacterium]|nr:lytic transglycosylase domain-containing protein [bacterium]MDY4100980.1 lytic transglycosylase domain-containing protein [Lachnospiraceae bacterium]
MKITSVTDANGITTTTIDTDAVSGGSADFSSQLNEYMKTDSSLNAIFEKAAKSYGVDVELLKAMAKAESDFDPNATSKSGAMGIMQLMPATAKGLGVTDAYDPEQNIMGGAKYIASLLDKYDGNVSYALAAYNAGSGNVDKYGGIPPFEETQNYVTKILGYLQNGGVEVPDRWTSVTGGSDSSEDMLTDALKQLFTREDYEDFLRLFLERLSQRLEEKVSGIGNENSDEKADSDPADNEEADVSDAYIAFRNFGNTNRMAVYLKPSEKILK